MTTNTEHKYTAEALLQAIDEITGASPVLALGICARARELDSQRKLSDAARPKPAHTDVAAKLAEALRLWIEYYGAIHDEDCPQDDTCDCEGRMYNDAANSALTAYDTAQAQCEGEAQHSGARRVVTEADVDRANLALDRLLRSRGYDGPIEPTDDAKAAMRAALEDFAATLAPVDAQMVEDSK